MMHDPRDGIGPSSPGSPAQRGAFPPARSSRLLDDPADAPVESPTLVMHVFRDWTERRWRRVCLAMLGVLAVLLLVARIFLAPLDESGASAALEPIVAFDVAAVTARAAQAISPPAPFMWGGAEGLSTPPPVPVSSFVRRFAWVDASEPSAARSLDTGSDKLTDVVVESIHVDRTGTLRIDPSDAVLDAARRRDLRVHLVADALRDGSMRATEVTELGRDIVATARFAKSLEAQLESVHAAGAVLELGEDELDVGGLAREAIVRAVRARVAPRTVALGFHAGTNAALVARAGELADLVFLHAHIDPDDSAPPVPVTPRRWFEEMVTEARRHVPVEKLVVLLPTHASAWPVRASGLSRTAAPARLMEWTEAIAYARVARTLPTWQSAASSALVVLPGSTGIAASHLVPGNGEEPRDAAIVVWLADAATFADELSVLRRAGIARVGVDGLGGADPRIWRVLGAGADAGAIERALAEIPRSGEMQSVGEGIELRVLEEQRDGEATAAVAPDGTIVSETYRRLPADVTVIHRAVVPSKMVALSFDDGPDPLYTPQVLDVLKKRGVHATFFIIGSRLEREPELGRRIVAEGHELGNHSFSHCDLSKVASRRGDLEIRSTNFLLEATTGYTTRLFRPPYRANDAPERADVTAIAAAERNGVAVISSSVDPRDWEDGAVTADIVKNVLAGAEERGSAMVLLHDGGGDRSHTVQALPLVIEGLSARGFRFGLVRDVFGGTSKDLVNPPATTRTTQRLAQATWRGGTWFLRALQWTALVALVLSSMRVLSLILFAAVDIRRYGRRGDARLTSNERRAVSVVVPAYNEAKVIERTISSVLASVDVDVEVVVLDDGSKDATGDVVARSFLRDTRVRLVRLQNGGKAAALNRGFKLASHPIVVALDADTIFLPETIAELVRRFEDPRVGAVAGRAVVGNTHSIMGRWQALEYVIGQAVERRAWHVFGLVSVVPGAVGAWRRDAVLDAGGFARDTLAEDCDLTLDLQTRGWRVDYAPDAIALTEAPESVRTLVKQRFRWSYGVLQALFKHRRAALRPGSRRVGLFMLPTILGAHLLTPMLAPAADLGAFIAIYLGFGASVIPFAIASVIADLSITVFAMRLDRAPAKLAWDWLVFRALYRWILFFALARAVFAALRGGAVGWGKLVRKGSVQAPTKTGGLVT